MNLKDKILIFLALILLGFLFSKQFGIRPFEYSPTALVSKAMKILVFSRTNEQLKKELETLQKKKEVFEEAVINKEKSKLAIKEELDTLKIINGKVEVEGPGIIFEINQDLNWQQAIDLLNGLKNAGAEVISFGGKRILINSYFKNAGKKLVLDNFILEKPYQIKAIGDKDLLFKSLTRPGGIFNQLGLKDTSIEKSDLIEIKKREDEKI